MQTWDPAAYMQHGSFVHGLAGGVLEWLNPQPGERILDIGCGDGQLTLRLTATGAQVTGVDASGEMLAAARARGVQADQASAEKLPYPDHCFDALFSNAALHWVHDHAAMLYEAHRVLRAGGRFVAEFGGHGNIAAIDVAFAAALERYGFAGQEQPLNYYPAPEIYKRRLERHGFTVERIALIPRPTPLGPGGMHEWLRTFRRGVLLKLPEEARDKVVENAVERLGPALCDEDGNWTADYMRLRFIARS